MNVMKLALLGTAALAAVSVSARADDLSALKAQIEALQADVAALQAAPAVPAGYSLISISKADAIRRPGFDDPVGQATSISIVPTADMPASTVVQFAGKVKAAWVWDNNGSGDSDSEIQSSAELVVTGTTDTAVGEVGAWIKFEDSWVGHSDSSYADNITEAWGWWRMTPELALGGGFDDDVSGIGHGGDWCSCNFITTVGSTGQVADDSSQLRLSYASGPISAAVSVGSHDSSAGDLDDDYIISAEVKYSADAFSAEVAGAFGEESSNVDVWQIGAGLTYKMDMVTLSVSAGTGEDGATGYNEASIFASANLSDSVRAELGAGWFDEEGVDADVGVYAGVYYNPVSQLTVGLEASWVDDGSLADDDVEAALVTVFSF